MRAGIAGSNPSARIMSATEAPAGNSAIMRCVRNGCLTAVTLTDSAREDRCAED
jgi:hypothetical protein